MNGRLNQKLLTREVLAWVPPEDKPQKCSSSAHVGIPATETFRIAALCEVTLFEGNPRRRMAILLADDDNASWPSINLQIVVMSYVVKLPFVEIWSPTAGAALVPMTADEAEISSEDLAMEIFREPLHTCRCSLWKRDDHPPKPILGMPTCPTLPRLGDVGP